MIFAMAELKNAVSQANSCITPVPWVAHRRVVEMLCFGRYSQGGKSRLYAAFAGCSSASFSLCSRINLVSEQGDDREPSKWCDVPVSSTSEHGDRDGGRCRCNSTSSPTLSLHAPQGSLPILRPYQIMEEITEAGGTTGSVELNFFLLFLFAGKKQMVISIDDLYLNQR